MRNFFLVSLIALVLHELAHLVAARVLGVRVKRFGISWRGPYVVREAGEPTANGLIALAGPGLNLLLAFIFWHSAPLFGLINMVLGVSNLFPIKGADGWRALKAFREAKQNKVLEQN